MLFDCQWLVAAKAVVSFQPERRSWRNCARPPVYRRVAKPGKFSFWAEDQNQRTESA
jgi:hypothetical protein